MNTCMTCKYAELLPGMNDTEAQGVCRLQPPVAQVMMTPKGPATLAALPTVRLSHDWCSHHVVQLVKPATGQGLRLEK